MAANDTIIDALTKYFIKCELLRDGAMRVDYLGEKPVEYTLETMPTDPIMKRYADGSTVRQYLFAFGSREYYSQDRLQNIKNSGFYEKLSDWVEAKSKAGELPELPDGMEVYMQIIIEMLRWNGSRKVAGCIFRVSLRWIIEECPVPDTAKVSLF